MVVMISSNANVLYFLARRVLAVFCLIACSNAGDRAFRKGFRRNIRMTSSIILMTVVPCIPYIVDDTVVAVVVYSDIY